MSTPHISSKLDEIAKVVIMPGDPLRAKYIAENFLEDFKEVNSVRNMLAYTGYYKGKKLTVMGSGMGMPSCGIYSYELFKFYDVDTIIRIGTTGSFQENVKLKDIVVAQSVSTNSNWQHQYDLPGVFSPCADFEIVTKFIEECKNNNVKFHVGNILSSDIFYDADPEAWKKWAKMGVLSVEMEAYAIISNANLLNKRAACILTVSDSLVTHESTSYLERQEGFTNMMKMTLETILKL